MEYNWYKKRNFVDQIIKTVTDIVTNSTEDIYKDYTVGFITLLNDISYFRGKKKNNIWAFTRDELAKLFSFEAHIIKKNGENPFARPLKSVLMTTISNYILKSRYNYNDD